MTFSSNFFLLGSFSLPSKGFRSGYSKNVYVLMHSENSKPTMWCSQTTPDEHPPMPPPRRRPALITLCTLTEFQLVWLRLCDARLFRSSCLVERTLTAVCALPAYRSSREYHMHAYVHFVAGWSSTSTTVPMSASSLLIVFPGLRLTPRRHRQADGQLSPLYPPSPSFSSFGAACVNLCCLPPPSVVRNIRLCCLV